MCAILLSCLHLRLGFLLFSLPFISWAFHDARQNRVLSWPKKKKILCQPAKTMQPLWISYNGVTAQVSSVISHFSHCCNWASWAWCDRCPEKRYIGEYFTSVWWKWRGLYCRWTFPSTFLSQRHTMCSLASLLTFQSIRFESIETWSMQFKTFIW